MKVIVDQVEVRGFESKVSKQTNTPYLIVYFEDVSGKASNVICRDINIASMLQKGAICNLHCDLQIGKFTKFELLKVENVEAGVA